MLPLLLALATPSHAGLGPDDVLVLYNADDPEAVLTAEYYADARDLADDHLCPLTGLDPATTQIDLATYETAIRDPYEACRDALNHPDDIDALVIVRGLPYRVQLAQGRVSLAAMLQVGRGLSNGRPIAGQSAGSSASVLNPAHLWGGYWTDDTTASFGASPWYMTSPRIARGEPEAIPGPFSREDDHARSGADITGVLFDVDLTGELTIVHRLDGFDHDDARALVDRALLADGSFPTAPFLCMRGSEGARGVRDGECEHALRMIAAAGGATEWVPTFDRELSDVEVIAYWTGTANLRDAIDGVTYAPGAIADNLTSFGAVPNNFFCDETGETCPENESQTSMARFVRAGASATQGTVAEPLNNVFPNAGTLLLYHQGYTLGESWLYNMRFLYWVNTWVGDPLMAPFAERPVVELPAEVPANRALEVLADHPDGIARLTLYVDGVKVFDDADPSLPGAVPEAWGVAPGDAVEVFAVAVAAPPPAIQPEGWPATEPVAFDPGTKGWVRGIVTIDEPVDDEASEPDRDDEPAGCACQAGAGAPYGLWLALLPLLALRRRRDGRPWR